MEFESERFISEETGVELLKNIGVKTDPKPKGELAEPEQVKSLLSDVDSLKDFINGLIHYLKENDPYHPHIFIKPNKEDMGIADRMLRASGINTAGYNGSFGHHVRNVMIKQIEEYIGNLIYEE